MNILITICARGGSKGLPGKNIRFFAGKPLIAWSIEHAKSISRVRRVIVSTDSQEIADVANEFGAEVPFMRPSHLATDDSPEWYAWRHALEFIAHDEGALPSAMLSVPVTAPLRQSIDIDNCLDEFFKGDADIVIAVTDAYRNPYFNMVKANDDGVIELVIPPKDGVTRRQDAPKVFDMTTVAYVADPDFIMAQSSIFAGCVKAVHVPVERSIDIDTLMDFRIAEFIFKHGHN